MYEVCTKGRLPHAGLNNEEVRNSIIDKSIALLNIVQDGQEADFRDFNLLVSLQSILDSCLEMEPENRPKFYEVQRRLDLL